MGKRILSIALIFTFSFSLGALEVDEKLTLRILRLSSSGKTVLVNRGQEDGLAEGDHAKFFTTAGVIARGVIVKVSPTRSVWSIYRMVKPDELKSEQVLSLKISSPVKMTDDPSKAIADLKQDGAEDTVILSSTMSNEDKSELMSLGAQEGVGVHTEGTASADGRPAETNSTGYSKSVLPTLASNTWEVWGGTSVPMYSTTTTSDTESVSSSGGGSSLTAGIEKYFYDPNSWANRFSLFGIVEKSTQDAATSSGVTSNNSVFSYGVGIDWHFYAPSPHISDMLICFVGISQSIGSSTDEVTSAGTTDSTTGSVSTMIISAGAKYYFAQTFGIRGAIEYYNRSETYSESETIAAYKRTVTGPRVLLGLSYRF